MVTQGFRSELSSIHGTPAEVSVLSFHKKSELGSSSLFRALSLFSVVRLGLVESLASVRPNSDVFSVKVV